MEKQYYKVLGVTYKELAKYNSIEEVQSFGVVSPGVESLTDALNLRKKFFNDYPNFYFTVRKCTADDCFVTMSTEQVDRVINANDAA